MLKLRKPIPVMYRGIVDTPKAKALLAKLANNRNKTIASYYFDEAPTIPNLAKGAYYWAKGNLFGGSEDPEDYIHIKGEPPIIGGPLKTISSTGAKVLKEVVGKRPLKVVEVIRNGVRDFLRGVARGTRVGRKEGAEEAVKAMNEKVSRAYKLGVLRGTLTAERTAKKTALQKALESVQEAQRKYKEGWTNGRKLGADILRRWLERSSKLATSSTSAGQLAVETPGLGFWGNTRRVLWETKNNNFGKSYKWRNAARVPIYMTGTPFIIGSATEGLPLYFKYMGTAFEKGRLAAGYKPDSTSNTSAVLDLSLVILDSTNNSLAAGYKPDSTSNTSAVLDLSLVILDSTNNSLDTIVPVYRNNNDPVTTSSREQLDSINKAWGR